MVYSTLEKKNKDIGERNEVERTYFSSFSETTEIEIEHVRK